MVENQGLRTLFRIGMKPHKLSTLLLLSLLYVVAARADLDLHHAPEAGHSDTVVSAAIASSSHDAESCSRHDPESSHGEDECPCPQHHPAGEQHHAGGHSCSFAPLVAPALHGPLDSGLLASSRPRSSLELHFAWQLEPGRTATGLAPPA